MMQLTLIVIHYLIKPGTSTRGEIELAGQMRVQPYCSANLCIILGYQISNWVMEAKKCNATFHIYRHHKIPRLKSVVSYTSVILLNLLCGK